MTVNWLLLECHRHVITLCKSSKKERQNLFIDLNTYVIIKRPLNSIRLLAVLLPNGLQMQQIPFILQQKIVLRLDALANIVERLMSCRKNTNKLWILFQKFFLKKIGLFLSLDFHYVCQNLLVWSVSHSSYARFRSVYYTPWKSFFFTKPQHDGFFWCRIWNLLSSWGYETTTVEVSVHLVVVEKEPFLYLKIASTISSSSFCN